MRPSESSTREPGGAVRTYHGRTIEELLPRIQEELGADAIIVRRREGLTGGVAGFFQHPFVELDATAGGPRLDVYDEELAAVTDVAVEHPAAPEYLPPTERPGSAYRGRPEQRLEYRPAFEPPAIRAPSIRAPFYSREPLRHGRDGRYVTEDLVALARAGTSQSTPLRPVGAPALEPRATEPSDPFARMLEQAASAGRMPAASTGAPPPSAADPHRSPSSTRSRAQATIRQRLLALGVSEQFAEELLEMAAIHIRPLAPRAGFGQAVRSALVQQIPVASPLSTRGAAIVLVGPGGAGKTSCCAALLGAYRKGSTLPASCATLLRGPDRGELRMLLSPQIRKPVAVHASRAAGALRKAREEGLLVIDTPPLSPGDRSGVRKLGGLLGGLKPERVVLVLPATLGAVATEQLLQALRPLGANALALTHTDETDQIGVAVEAACRFGLAPEYLLKRARSGGWAIGRADPTGLATTLVQ